MHPFVLLLVALALSTSSMAQTSWRGMPEGTSVSLDTRTAVGESYTFSGTAASTLLSARVPLGGRWTLHGELTLAFSSHAAGEGASEYALDGTALAAGSPYLGAEVELANALVLEAGYRLPAPNLGLTSYKPHPVDDRASFQFPDGLWGGIVTDPHRFEVYQSYQALVVAIRAEPKLTDRIRARLRVAPVVPSTAPDGTILIGYSAQAVGDLNVADLSVGIVGQRIASRYVWGILDPSPSPSLLVQVGRSVGSVRPGLTASVPLGDHRFAPDAVVGFSLDVSLR